MLKVSASPHIRHNDSTKGIMQDVVISLTPAILAASFLFGARALAVIVISVVFSVLFEYLARKIMKRENSIDDWSAVVTGILLAFSLPPDIPFWIPILGSFFAIVLTKQLFGGLGMNFINPALGARIILSISFPASMNSMVMKQEYLGASFLDSTDLISKATPLTELRASRALSGASAIEAASSYSYSDLFLGLKPGMIGEVCLLALCLGALYLLWRRVISLHVPLAFIGTSLLFVALCGQDPLYHLMSGALVLGAFFMATDYVTNPDTAAGQVIFGIGCGLLLGLLRVFGASVGGLMYSIVLMNILTPHIDNLVFRLSKIRRAKAVNNK